MALKDKIIDRAQKFVQKGNLDKAIAEYRAVVDIDPKDIAIRLRLGELYVKVNRTADAIREYSEAAKVNTQKGFYLKAIAVYKQILKLDDNLDIHHKLADLYTKQRLIADAVSEYSQIAAIFERKGRNNEVLELLRKMLDIDPDNIGIKLRLADLYHKLSFEKDAIAEYESIFGMLIAQGKVEKAEKVYLGLYNSNPKEPVVLKGLSSLYAKKNDSARFLKFAVPLFHIYRETDDTDAARSISAEILRFKPDDHDCVEFLKRPVQKEPEPLAAPPESAGTETAAADEVTTQAPESWTEDRGAKASTEAPVVERPVEPQHEDEIEITLEGFEDTAREEAEAPSVPDKIAVEEAVAPHAAPVEAREEAEAEVEIDIGDLEEEELKASAAPVEEEKPVEPVAEFEITGNEPVEAGGPEAVLEPLTEAEEPVAGPGEISAGPEEIKAEEAGGQEAVLEPLIEAEETTAGPGEISAESIDELLEAGLEEAIEEVNVKISEAEERQPVQPPRGAGYEVLEESVEDIEGRIEALLEDEPQEAVPADIFEDMERGQAPASTASAEQETESAEAVREASEAVTELIEKISPEEMLVEPEGIRMEEVPDEDRSEDYVDLSAELGMEETVKDMAGSWSGGDSKEAYDEFKSGISQQLSREDTETHYNLGIAYMEMELYGEASKEFKIALKDPHLEFDCLTRLGLCSMSEGAPSEAVQYYTRGLKLEGRSDSERMGMMYELALAYEAAGDRENAGRIFNSIYDANPEYRDVAKKVPLAVPGQGKKNRIPLDDGMIEVELL